MKIFYYVFILILTASLSVLGQQGDVTAYFAANWSPDGKYLAFTQSELKMGPPRSMKADIYVMKADGTEVKKITGDQLNELLPSWSNDGKRIAFMNTVMGSNEGNIYIMNSDGSQLTQITKNSGTNNEPSFSPNGKQIAFNSNRETGELKFQIYVMNADGTNIKRLTTDSSVTYFAPKWSPDGKKLVYYVEKGDRKDQIWSMNADGSNQTLLTGGSGHNFYPSWSSDGKKIIFSGFREANSDPTKDAPTLYIMNADGSDIKPFGNLKGSGASFSPNGKKIVYIGGKFPVTGIYVANSDGSNPVKLIGN
jgi:Tol biopolymer transport system component